MGFEFGRGATDMAGLLKRTGLNALALSGGGGLVARWRASRGVILRFQRVVPLMSGGFAPQMREHVSPEFFERLVRALPRWGFDLVSLDEAQTRLTSDWQGRPFACLTFDSGYRDVHDHAWPILRRNRAPFTIYVAANFVDHVGEAWWMALARIIETQARIGLAVGNDEYRFVCTTRMQKAEVYHALEELLWSLQSDHDIRATMRELCMRYNVNLSSFNQYFLNWDQVREMAADPLVTIGTQSVSHAILTKLRPSDAEKEMEMGRSVIEAAIGQRPKHFAYPFGDARSFGAREVRMVQALGFSTAVTAQPRAVRSTDRDSLYALPRISVRGDNRSLRYLKLFARDVARPFA